MLSSISNLQTGNWHDPNGRLADSPEKIREVAAEFESLLVAHMLKTVRESSSGGWLGGGEDQAGTTMVDMAEAQFARSIASGGGLGLRDVIAEGLLPTKSSQNQTAAADKK